MIMSANTGNPKFALGRIVATPGALEVIEASGHSPADFITRHVRLEQGDLCDEDHQLNAEAVKDGSRILSSYELGDQKLWVITEAADDDGQRSATTLLLSHEY